MIVATLVGSGAFLVRLPDHATLGVSMLGLAGVVWLVHAARDWRRALKKQP